MVHALKGENMRNLKIVILILAAVLFLGFQPAYSDDIVEAINEAVDAYNEKEYQEAIESLDYAKQLIQQMRSEGLMKYLPEALPGWESKSPKTQNMGMLGGMAGVSKEYLKTGQRRKRVTISIFGQSPIMQGMMAMFNPMYAGSSGGKLQKIKRNKAIVKYNPDSNSGEISVLVKKKFIVTIKGSSVEKMELMDYAKTIDYKGLKEF